MDNNIILDLLFVSMGASIISTNIIQKIKETITLGKIFNKIISLIIPLVIGFIYAYTFYQENILYAIWISLFTLIGSDNLYKAYKSKYNLNQIKKEK